jgi:hypothetical protein
MHGRPSGRQHEKWACGGWIMAEQTRASLGCSFRNLRAQASLVPQCSHALPAQSKHGVPRPRPSQRPAILARLKGRPSNCPCCAPFPLPHHIATTESKRSSRSIPTFFPFSGFARYHRFWSALMRLTVATVLLHTGLSSVTMSGVTSDRSLMKDTLSREEEPPLQCRRKAVVAALHSSPCTGPQAITD